ncbi:transposable element Tcb1 transposase [Trichonephila clavipes]|nr:transposable element Tcb1 transposase [Trichonephila clavipes]
MFGCVLWNDTRMVDFRKILVSTNAQCRRCGEAVPPSKCFDGPPVDRDRHNAHSSGRCGCEIRKSLEFQSRQKSRAPACHLKALFKAWRFRRFQVRQLCFSCGFFKNRSVMSLRKQRSAFHQVSEFDRGRIVAYRDCGFSFRKIGSRVGRNQKTVMRIWNHWMQEGTTDRRGRSYPPQCTTSREDRQIGRMAVTDHSVISRTVAQHIECVTHHRTRKEGCGRQNGMKLSLLTRHASVQHHNGRIRVWRHRGERMLNSCVIHHHTGPSGPSPGILVWGGIGYHSRTPLVLIADTLNSQRYIFEVLEPVVLPYLQGLATAIFQQNKA